MKLIKINEEHYVIVDDTKINVGDWITDKYRVWKWNDDCSLLGRKKIIHSTQPLECDRMWTSVNGKQWMCNTMLCCGKILNLKTKPISLQEVKELLGEVDVEKKAKENYVEPLNKQGEKRAQLVGNGGLFGFNKFKKAFKKGYTQALEDNKEKKYTDEDVINIVDNVSKNWFKCYSHNDKKEHLLKITKYLQKTEWEVEIINGKLTLK